MVLSDLEIGRSVHARAVKYRFWDQSQACQGSDDTKRTVYFTLQVFNPRAHISVAFNL